MTVNADYTESDWSWDDHDVALGARTPEFTDHQRATLARIEATPAAPESFDPIAALRRVEALADRQAAAADLPVLKGDRFDAGVAAAYRDSAEQIRAALSPSDTTPGAQA